MHQLFIFYIFRSKITINCQRVRIWKESVVYYFKTFLIALKKRKKNFGQGNMDFRTLGVVTIKHARSGLGKVC